MEKSKQKVSFSWMKVLSMMFILMSFMGISFAANDYVKIQLGDVQGKAGSTIRVPVKVESFNGTVGAFQLPISYDPSKLTFTKIITKTGTESSFTTHATETEVRIAFLNMNMNNPFTYDKLVYNNDTLLELEFTIKPGVAEGTTDVKLLPISVELPTFDILFAIDDTNKLTHVVAKGISEVTILPEETGTYKEWTAQTNVAEDKAWVLTFNLALDKATIVQNNIYVLDESGNKVPMINIIINEPNDTKLKLVPQQNYTKGKTYTLYIKDVISKDGKKMEKNEKMSFTIKN